MLSRGSCLQGAGGSFKVEAGAGEGTRWGTSSIMWQVHDYLGTGSAELLPLPVLLGAA